VADLAVAPEAALVVVPEEALEADLAVAPEGALAVVLVVVPVAALAVVPEAGLAAAGVNGFSQWPNEYK
jgi:hypothetical protein